MRFICGFGDFFNIHSRMRTTLYPALDNCLVTSLSRFMFLSIFARQNFRFDFGRRFFVHSLHPCQKQPSTKTASLHDGNTKSGCPVSFEFLRQPVIPYSRKSAMSRNSVLEFPFERIFDIISERFSFDTLSIVLFYTHTDFFFIGAINGSTKSYSRLSGRERPPS